VNARIGTKDGGNSITPISTIRNKAGKPIRVGREPEALAVTRNGKTVYVVNVGSDTVTPVSTSTDKTGPAIQLHYYPLAIVITS
jgi:YVTN family beta-propeller protein